MGEGILEVKKPKKRNVVAASLHSPKFRKRVVPNKRKEKSNQKKTDYDLSESNKT
jgi:stalled ribosome alternative rescue factor ArfA